MSKSEMIRVRQTRINLEHDAIGRSLVANLPSLMLEFILSVHNRRKKQVNMKCEIILKPNISCATGPIRKTE